MLVAVNAGQMILFLSCLWRGFTFSLREPHLIEVKRLVTFLRLDKIDHKTDDTNNIGMHCSRSSLYGQMVCVCEHSFTGFYFFIL